MSGGSRGPPGAWESGYARLWVRCDRRDVGDKGARTDVHCGARRGLRGGIHGACPFLKQKQRREVSSAGTRHEPAEGKPQLQKVPDRAGRAYGPGAVARTRLCAEKQFRGQRNPRRKETVLRGSTQREFTWPLAQLREPRGGDLEDPLLIAPRRAKWPLAIQLDKDQSEECLGGKC